MSNLPRNFSRPQVEDIFAPFGRVHRVQLKGSATDGSTAALVQLETLQQVFTAIDQLDGREIQEGTGQRGGVRFVPLIRVDKRQLDGIIAAIKSAPSPLAGLSLPRMGENGAFAVQVAGFPLSWSADDVVHVVSNMQVLIMNCTIQVDAATGSYKTAQLDVPRLSDVQKLQTELGGRDVIDQATNMRYVL